MGIAKRLAALVDEGRITAEKADELLAGLEDLRQGQESNGQRLMIPIPPDDPPWEIQ